MTGRVQGDATVVVEQTVDAANVYARGYFGTLGSGRLLLDRSESAYLLEMGRLEVQDGSGRGLTWEELFRRAVRTEPGFGIRYLVYRDLRQRGYVVRAGPAPVVFSVLPRGGILHKTPARYWVEPTSERRPFELARIREIAERARGARKALLLAVVDEESDLTYYAVRQPVPTGTQTSAPEEGENSGLVAEDRVLVVDHAAATRLGRRAYGSHVGDRLELSFLEAGYLAAKGCLELRDVRSHRRVTASGIEAKAARLDPHHAERRSVYAALREQGLVVKTGFKYGSHFRAYPRDPERAHARYLVQAVPESFSAPWPEIAGTIRLAQGVRKEHLLATPDRSGGVRFLSLERIRP